MKHMNIIKRSCALILCLVMCVSYFCVFTVSSAAAEEEKAEVTSKVYPVTDDAYIRKENSGSNYNYETLSSSHGIQFADKKTNVLNVKLHTGNNRNIRTLFKFNLPENSDFDVYELVFNVARIADPLTGDQTYNLYYATDIDWSEKKIENGGNVVKEGVTWNSIASLTPDDDEHLLGSWIVEKGTDQAYMSSENKKVTIDISEKVKGLVESGAKTLTVSIVAQNSMETTAQIHSKESRDGTLGAKLVATKLGGYSRESLENFIQRCETTITDACSEEKIAAFEAALEAAKQVCSDNSASQEDIAASYRSLYKAKTALLIATDTISIAEKDAYIRQDQADKANDCENKDGYKLLNVKESSAHKRHIISLMEFKLPTKEQAEKYGYGTYEFEFHIYSNPDPQNGPQTYNFYYATDLVWEETSVTWNGIRSQVPSDDEHLLADYKIYNNITYSGLSADNKKVVCDITEDIKALIEQGVTSITVFCVAKDDKATSLQ